MKAMKSPALRRNRWAVCSAAALHLALMAVQLPGLARHEPYFVFVAFYNAISLHYLLGTAFLFCVFTGDEFYHHPYVRVRRGAETGLFCARLMAVLRQAAGAAALLAAGFFLLAACAGQLGQVGAAGVLPALCGFLNLGLGFALMGAGYVALTARTHGRRARLCVFLALYVVISFDFMCTAGYVAFDSNLVYAQAASMAFYLAGEPAAVVFRGAAALSFKLAAAVLVGLALSVAKRKGGRKNGADAA